MSRFVLIMLLLAATASPLKAFAVVSQIPSKTQVIEIRHESKCAGSMPRGPMCALRYMT